MASQINSLRKSILFLCLPALQYLVLRLFLREVLGLRLGFPNTNDFDFLVPVPVAFFLFIHSLELAAPLPIRLQKPILLTNLLASIGFVVTSTYFETISWWSPILAVSLWFAMLLVVALTSFCVFTPLGSFFKNANRLAVVPALFIGGSLYFYMNGFRWLWLYLGNATSQVLHSLFTLISLDSVKFFFTAEEALRIDHADLSVRIAKGCGGGDGLFYFTLAFLMFVMVRRQKWSPHVMASIFTFGLVYMFFLNIARILTLFFAGIWLRQTFGLEVGTRVFLSLAHLHTGWLIYTVGIFVYLRASAHLARGENSQDTNDESRPQNPKGLGFPLGQEPFLPA